MRKMGLLAITPGPHTSKPAPGHKFYPYLLRGVQIERVNQVWSTDITYVPMRKGFLYLTAVMDWHSRYVLSWELSNTMESLFCVEALERALEWGEPEVFNTDQGRSLPARLLRKSYWTRESPSAWTVGEEPWTTCSSSGCGGR